jgi:hypothetical protein
VAAAGGDDAPRTVGGMDHSVGLCRRRSLRDRLICFYGASSLQVMRRMNALLTELIAGLPAERRPALQRWQCRLDNSIEANFTDLDQRRDASARDRQGFGISRRPAA